MNVTHCGRGLAGLVLLAAMCSAHGADARKGGQIYAKHCAQCHGNAGVPVMPGAPNLTRPEALMKPDGALAAIVRNGRLTMPGFRGVLQESEIQDVVVYMRTLLR
jgi:mono/diheme cytochrome c family protein